METYAIDLWYLSPPNLTGINALDFDHIGAEVGYHLRTARPLLQLGEVNHANALVW
jgi:hypothetical protein